MYRQPGSSETAARQVPARAGIPNPHQRWDDPGWLDRARRFAMQAITQCQHDRAGFKQLGYALWTGDAVLAIYSHHCRRPEAVAIPGLDLFQDPGRISDFAGLALTPQITDRGRQRRHWGLNLKAVPRPQASSALSPD